MTLSLSATSLDRLYPSVLEALLVHGEESSPRGMATRELRGVTLQLLQAESNIVRCPIRKLNYSFGCAEALWMMTGMNDVETVNAVNKNIAAFSDNGRTFYGAYGPMITEQLPYVIDTLRNDPSTRQAVLTIWRPRPGPTKDVPCTVSMQFFIRRNAVHLHVTMRSNDAWLGLPYDVFNFTTIQHLVASELGLALGSYVHHVGSLHLYEKHYTPAQQSIDAAHKGTSALSYFYTSFVAGDWCMPAAVRMEFAALVATASHKIPPRIVEDMREKNDRISSGFRTLLDAVAHKVIGSPLPEVFRVRS